MELPLGGNVWGARTPERLVPVSVELEGLGQVLARSLSCPCLLVPGLGLGFKVRDG